MTRSLVLEGEGITIAGDAESAFFAPAPAVPIDPPLISSVSAVCRADDRNPATRVARDFLREQLENLATALAAV